MYEFKKEMSEKIKKFNLTEIANIAGVSRPRLSLIVNGKVKTKKITAYSITKSFDNEAEIDDYFNKA